MRKYYGIKDMEKVIDSVSKAIDNLASLKSKREKYMNGRQEEWFDTERGEGYESDTNILEDYDLALEDCKNDLEEWLKFEIELKDKSKRGKKVQNTSSKIEKSQAKEKSISQTKLF